MKTMTTWPVMILWRPYTFHLWNCQEIVSFLVSCFRQVLRPWTSPIDFRRPDLAPSPYLSCTRCTDSAITVTVNIRLSLPPAPIDVHLCHCNTIATLWIVEKPRQTFYCCFGNAELEKYDVGSLSKIVVFHSRDMDKKFFNVSRQSWLFFIWMSRVRRGRPFIL